MKTLKYHNFTINNSLAKAEFALTNILAYAHVRGEIYLLVESIEQSHDTNFFVEPKLLPMLNKNRHIKTMIYDSQSKLIIV